MCWSLRIGAASLDSAKALWYIPQSTIRVIIYSWWHIDVLHYLLAKYTKNIRKILQHWGLPLIPCNLKVQLPINRVNCHKNYSKFVWGVFSPDLATNLTGCITEKLTILGRPPDSGGTRPVQLGQPPWAWWQVPNSEETLPSIEFGPLIKKEDILPRYRLTWKFKRNPFLSCECLKVSYQSVKYNNLWIYEFELIFGAQLYCNTASIYAISPDPGTPTTQFNKFWLLNIQ